MDSHVTPNRSTWKFWLSRIALVVLVPAMLLGLVELGLWLADFGNPTTATSPCTAQGKPATCENLFYTTTFFPRGLVRTPRPYAIPAVKAPATYRIFVLGESAAYGDPDPAYAFSRYLEVMLQTSFPNMHFEVYNTGITAINSHLLLPIAKELANQKPDMFIVYAGNNEVVGPFGPGTVLASSAMNLQVIRASMILRSSRLGQAISFLLEKFSGKGPTKPQEWRGLEMFLDRQVPASSPRMKYVYKNFASNLEDMIKVAQESGARVLLTTVGTNLKDCAPFASAHRTGLSQEALQSWDDAFRRAVTLEATGQYVEALELYRSAEKIDSSYAELQFRIARSFWKLGDYQNAREHYIRAQDLDTLRFRADSEINSVIRGFGSQVGVDLVDAAAILDAESPHGISGSEMFYEHVHLKPRANYLIARAMFEQILKNLPPETRRTSESLSPPSEEECERLLALTPHDRGRLAAEMLLRMQRPPFTNQSNHNEQIWELQADAQQLTTDSPAETDAKYRWAITRNPNDKMLRLKYGLFLFPLDQSAAVLQLRMARPYDGFPVMTPDGRFIN